jgi:hypothetical protein
MSVAHQDCEEGKQDRKNENRSRRRCQPVCHLRASPVQAMSQRVLRYRPRVTGLSRQHGPHFPPSVTTWAQRAQILRSRRNSGRSLIVERNRTTKLLV